MSFEEAVKTVYGGEKSPYLSAYSKERFIQDRTSSYADPKQSKIVRDNATGYALSDYLQVQYPDLKRVSYDGGQPNLNLVVDSVYFDPVRRSFIAKRSSDNQAQFFSSYEEAQNFIQG